MKKAPTKPAAPAAPPPRPYSVFGSTSGILPQRSLSSKAKSTAVTVIAPPGSYLPILYDGYLEKMGGPFNKWRRRYFVLKFGWLEYSEPDDHEKLIGVTSMNFVKVCDGNTDPTVAKKPFSFIILEMENRQNARMCLAAESEPEKVGWIKAILAASSSPETQKPNPHREMILSEGRPATFGSTEKALIAATKTGKHDKMKELIVRGVDATRCTKKGSTPLHIAAAAGDEVAVLMVVPLSEVNARDQTGKTALHYACMTNNGRSVQELLARKARLFIADLEGNTPFFYAQQNVQTRNAIVAYEQMYAVPIWKDAVDEVIRFIDGGHDINWQDSFGSSLLHLSCTDASKRCAKMLLDRGAEVDIENSVRGTPLHACIRGLRQRVPLERMAQAPPPRTKRRGKLTAAQNAKNVTDAQANMEMEYRTRFEIAKLLLTSGADVNATDSFNNCALHLAVYQQDYRVCQLLLERGAMVGRRDGRNGSTPLHVATEMDNVQLAELLLSFGSEMSVKNADGDSAYSRAMMNSSSAVAILFKLILHGRELITAVQQGNLMRAREKVRDAPRSVNVQDSDRRTALHHAFLSGNAQMVRMLLNAGARIDIKDMNGESLSTMYTEERYRSTVGEAVACVDEHMNEMALIQCAKDGEFPTLAEILDVGRVQNVDLSDDKGWTALMYAAQAGNDRAGNLLLTRANPNLTDPETGLSALHIAVKNNKPGFCEILCCHPNIDVNVTEKEYDQTPSHFAAKHGLTECLNILVRHMANINIPDASGKTPYEHTICSVPEIPGTDRREVSGILEREKDGRELLEASKTGNLPKVQQLIGKDPKLINFRGGDKSRTPLHMAASIGSNAVMFLLGKGADCLIKDVDGFTPMDLVPPSYKSVQRAIMINTAGTQMLACAKEGDTTQMQKFFSGHVGCDYVDHKAFSALHYAVSESKLNTVKCLLDMGAITNIQNKDGDTPLHLAVSRLIRTKGDRKAGMRAAGRKVLQFQHSIKIAELLMDHGANIMIKNEKRETPYDRLKSANGDDNDGKLQGVFKIMQERYAAQELFDFSASGDVSSLKNKILEIEGKNEEYIGSGMRKKTDLATLKDGQGLTPLRQAIENHHLDCVRLLIEHNALCEERDLELAMETQDSELISSIRSCVMGNKLLTAGREGDYDTVNTLIDEPEIDFDYQGMWGLTATHFAALSGYKDILELLVEDAQVDPDKRDDYGRTALHYSSLFGHSACSEILLDADADPNVTDHSEGTPFTYATSSGIGDAMWVLLESGKVDTTRLEGSQSLHFAAHSGNEKAIKYLLRQGVDVNFKGEDGLTPLHVSCQGGHVGAVKLLCNKNANIMASAENGLTPLAIAVQMGNTAICEVLLRSTKKREQREVFETLNENGYPIKTIIHHAIMQQNISTFLEVMKYAEKDDVMRGDYISPLHLAVVKNDRTMIELLLKKEADPSWTCSFDEDKLVVSPAENRIDVTVAKAAIDGQDPSQHQGNRRHPLGPLHGLLTMINGKNCFEVAKMMGVRSISYLNSMYWGQVLVRAASVGNASSVIQVLGSEGGGNVMAVDFCGRSALHNAILGGHYECARVLIEHGCVNPVADNDGKTAEEVAVEKGEEEYVELFKTFEKNSEILKEVLESGKNNPEVIDRAIEAIESRTHPISFANVAGFSVLHVAIDCDDVARVDKLISLGIDVNMRFRTEPHRTVLQYAVQVHSLESMKLLLAAGADIDATDDNGFTVRDFVRTMPISVGREKKRTFLNMLNMTVPEELISDDERSSEDSDDEKKGRRRRKKKRRNKDEESSEDSEEEKKKKQKRRKKKRGKTMKGEVPQDAEALSADLPTKQAAKIYTSMVSFQEEVLKKLSGFEMMNGNIMSVKDSMRSLQATHRKSERKAAARDRYERKGDESESDDDSD